MGKRFQRENETAAALLARCMWPHVFVFKTWLILWWWFYLPEEVSLTHSAHQILVFPDKVNYLLAGISQEAPIMIHKAQIRFLNGSKTKARFCVPVLTRSVPWSASAPGGGEVAALLSALSAYSEQVEFTALTLLRSPALCDLLAESCGLCIKWDCK